MSDPKLATPAAQAGTTETSGFDTLMDEVVGTFGRVTSQTAESIKVAVVTLAKHALEGQLVSGDAVKTINALIAEIDRKLSEQINLIMHHDDFRALEGTWRGLHHLVSKTETGANLKIKVLNAPKKDLARTFKKFTGASWDQSPLFKQIYEEEFGAAGGQPYGALVGDYYFDHNAEDVLVLKGMAQIAAAAHAPFISGTGPSLMGMESWLELSKPADLAKKFTTPEYAPWRSLRDSEDSRYLALTLPRFLSRLPYGKENPTEKFVFTEDVAGADHNKFVWSNAAYAMAANVTRAFKQYGWCASIRGRENGGSVEGLPCHTFPTDDGGIDQKCPTEIAISNRRDAELSNCGLLSLVHWKNTDFAVFMGAQSLQKPVEYVNPDATANARLSARLPYLFAVSRFAHYLKAMMNDKIGTTKSRDQLADWLERWIAQYITKDPNAPDEVKAEKPLAAAELVIEDVPDNPGYYKARFSLRPHYQLEGMTITLSLVSKLPSERQGG